MKMSKQKKENRNRKRKQPIPAPIVIPTKKQRLAKERKGDYRNEED